MCAPILGRLYQKTCFDEQAALGIEIGNFIFQEPYATLFEIRGGNFERIVH